MRGFSERRRRGASQSRPQSLLRPKTRSQSMPVLVRGPLAVLTLGVFCHRTPSPYALLCRFDTQRLELKLRNRLCTAPPPIRERKARRKSFVLRDPCCTYEIAAANRSHNGPLSLCERIGGRKSFARWHPRIVRTKWRVQIVRTMRVFGRFTQKASLCERFASSESFARWHPRIVRTKTGSGRRSRGVCRWFSLTIMTLLPLCEGPAAISAVVTTPQRRLPSIQSLLPLFRGRADNSDAITTSEGVAGALRPPGRPSMVQPGSFLPR